MFSQLRTMGVIVVSACLLSACSTLGGDSSGLGGTRFYSLTALALADPKPLVKAQPNLRMGVGPIGLPRLLRRPQIVTRKSNTEIAMAEKHQWGGILKEDLSRVLTENFSSILGTDNIEEYPWKLSFKPAYSVRIDIDQLDGQLGQTVTLKARWRLLRGREEVAIENTTIKTKVNGGGYNAYVTAQSHALLLLTKTIAQRMTSR